MNPPGMLVQLQKNLTVIKLSSNIQEKLQYNQPWKMKFGDPEIDVPMDCFDGAEICESVGIFILNKLSNIIDENSIGLYRDLGVFDKLSGSQTEQEKEENYQNFQRLWIFIDTKVKYYICRLSQYNFKFEN